MEKQKKCKVKNCNYPVKSKGFCNNHYWQDYKKNYKPKQNKKDQRNKVAGSMSIFFNDIKSEIPNNCQCCSNDLTRLKYINFTVCLAHILPKSKEEFYLISTNKKNIVFLCDECHNGFDNKGDDWFEKQNDQFKNLVKNRVKYLSNYLTEQQQTKIKDYLL